MDKINDDLYNKEISKRIALIIEYTNLEILGFAKFIDVSKDIIYSILSERRILSNKIAKTIGEKLNFDGHIIFNLNVLIPETIKSSEKLILFKKANKHNLNYFVSTWNDKKLSTIIKTKLINRLFFEEHKYTWEVTNELKKYVRDINPDLINKQLKYLAETGELKSDKALLKLRNGSYGVREVDIYFK